LVIEKARAIVGSACVAAMLSATASGRPDSPRPTQAAVFVHEQDRPGRLAIVDLKTHGVRFVVPDDVATYDPVWSPTSVRLSYATEEGLRVYVDGIAGDRPFIRLPGFRGKPYLYSADEKWIAAPLDDAVAFLPLPADPRAAIGTKVDRVALAGCGEPNLLWSTDGKSLLALCTPGGGKPGWIVRIAPDTLKTSNQPAGETGRLLGWHDGALVVEGGGGVSILSSDGSLRPLFKAAEAEFVLAWLRGPGEALFVEGNEDSGYPTVLRLVGPNPASSRPWLHDFGRMNGFNFTPDGSWTMFVRVLGGDREGGDAYLVQTGSEQATKVLPATAERSYSSPIVRPPGRP
jgi:hypothetical protein